MNIPKISSFLEIIKFVSRDTLVVLDIDETILHYLEVSPDYWHCLFEKYYHELKDYKKAEEMSLQEWKKLVESSNPVHTDEEGMNILLNIIDAHKAKLIFVTARNSEMSNITELHLRKLNIPEDVQIFYDSNEKGKRLLDMQISKNKIIFVDDLDKNLENVKEHLGDKAKCFKFVRVVHRKLNFANYLTG